MYADTNTVSKAGGRAVQWNKGKLISQKPPLKLKEIWAIRIRLQLDHRTAGPARSRIRYLWRRTMRQLCHRPNASSLALSVYAEGQAKRPGWRLTNPSP
jgi:hypothetical protein